MTAPEVFSKGNAKGDRDQEALTAYLYQQIGQLKVERDFLSEKSGQSSPGYGGSRKGIDAYLDLYNRERPHQSLGYRAPAQMFVSGIPLKFLPNQPLALSSRDAVSDFTVGVSLNLALALS